MGRCVVDATGLAGWIGSSVPRCDCGVGGAGVAALLPKRARPRRQQEGGTAPPGRLVPDVGRRHLHGRRRRPAIAWTVAGQLLVGCSVPVARCSRRWWPGDRARCPLRLPLLWGVTGALGYGIHPGRRRRRPDGCAERRRALWWLTGVAAATSTASPLVATAAGKRSDRRPPARPRLYMRQQRLTCSPTMENAARVPGGGPHRPGCRGLFATAQSAWGTTAVMSAAASAGRAGPQRRRRGRRKSLGPLPGSREPRA